MPEIKITLSPESSPGYVHAKGLTNESAEAASRELQANQLCHIFTGDKILPARLHNHVVYIVLCLWSLGASPELIAEHAKRNIDCTLPPPKSAEETTVSSLLDESKLAASLGDEDCYQDLLIYFEREIERLGFDEVLQKYLLRDSELAKAIYPRMFHGYVHSFMHVGLGLEYNQPAILAEGLAATLVHSEPYYTAYHQACRDVHAGMKPGDKITLLDTYKLCLQDEVIADCTDWALVAIYSGPEDSWESIMHLPIPKEEPWRDRVWGRAGKNMAAITGRWGVSADDDLDRAAAEVINTCIYTTCAVMLPPHEFRIDFFLLHMANASYWLQAFMSRDSISRAQKARLITDCGRLLTFIAAGIGMPALHPEVLESHVNKTNNGAGSDWDALYAKVCHHADDGHMIKFIRALKHGEDVSKPYATQSGFPMRQEMFLKAANAVLDNTSGKPMAFLRHYDIIRGVGHKEAWEGVPVTA